MNKTICQHDLRLEIFGNSWKWVTSNQIFNLILPQGVLTASKFAERPGSGPEILLSNDKDILIFGLVVLVLSVGIIQMFEIRTVSAPVEGLGAIIYGEMALMAAMLSALSSIMNKYMTVVGVLGSKDSLGEIQPS